MKKIFCLILILIAAKLGFSQAPKYPIPQGSGNNDSTITIGNVFQGRHGLVNGVYTDTTQANGQHIKQYGGAQIFTSTDNSIWVRNAAATKWTKGSGIATVASYGKNATGDSTVLLLSDGTRYAAKDSLGSGAAAKGSFFGITTASINPAFIVIGIGIVQPTSSYVRTDTITWNFLTSGGHGVSFFDSVKASIITSNRLTIFYPAVKNVFGMYVNPDETVSSHMMVQGATVGLTSADIAAYQPTLTGIALQGNGTGSWTITSSNTNVTLSTFSTADGGTSFDLPTSLGDRVILDYEAIPVTYVGDHQYTIDRQYSAIGMYNAKFKIITPSGGYLDTYPTSTDRIIISPTNIQYSSINLGVYDNNNTFLIPGTSTNFWISAYFEAWMVANATSKTSINVRWQTDYPAATTYKIYRDITPTFATQVLIHTGTEGTFEDTGLTAATVYYYKMVAVISGVDTYVTNFPCPTNE